MKAYRSALANDRADPVLDPISELQRLAGSIRDAHSAASEQLDALRALGVRLTTAKTKLTRSAASGRCEVRHLPTRCRAPPAMKPTVEMVR